MKKILILIVVVCVGLQSNLSMCAEEPGWFQWLSQKLGMINKRKAFFGTAAVGGAGFVTSEVASNPLELNFIDYNFIVEIDRIRDYALGAGAAALFISGIMLLDEALGDSSETRQYKMYKIKAIIEALISNQLLYPTRSSQIHALLKKDEFLKYVDLYAEDKDGLLQEACAQLSRKISEAGYSDTRKKEDNEIDAHISELKRNINHLSLEKQIDALKWVADLQNTLEKMRGYLSLYYRLQNKLAIEKQLTPEQLEKRRSLNWK